MTEAPSGQFVEMFPGRFGLFQAGVLVADYRPSGAVFRVTLYFDRSLCPYRQTLCSTEAAARRVCVELAQETGDTA